jgi:hypothetical protein
MALSPSDGYGLSQFVCDREAQEHLLAPEMVKLRHLITDAGLMGNGTIVLSLEPEDGTVFEIRLRQNDSEMRITPALIKSRTRVDGPVPG